MALTISDTYLYEILTAVGYPIINEEDLELTKVQIKDLLLLPAIREYWRWFPKKSEESYQVNTTFEIDFPNATTFGVLDARLAVSTYRGSSALGHPLIDELRIKVSRAGYYGTRNNYNLSQALVYERTERVSAIEYQKAFRARVYEEDRKIKGYANVLGTLNVIWADYSEDFADIPFNRLNDVIKLCKANVLRYLGELRNQSATDLPNELDGSDFIDRADELETEVMDKFRRFSKPVIIRS